MVPPSMICMSIYFSRYITIICSVAFSYISGRFAVNFSPQWGQRKWSCSVVSYSLCLMNCSPPGSSVHGIFQARVWSGLLFPSPGDLPNPRIELGSPALQADALPSEPPGKPLSGDKISTNQVLKIKTAKGRDKWNRGLAGGVIHFPKMRNCFL